MRGTQQESSRAIQTGLRRERRRKVKPPELFGYPRNREPARRLDHEPVYWLC